MIPVNRAHIIVAARNHPGRTGKLNEDRFAVSAYKLGSGNSTASLLAIVADGIGGHSSGELAAETAVNTISRSVAESDGFEPLNTLRKAIRLASQSIAQQAMMEPQHLGMGTTCACVWLIGKRLYIASVGDSRIYLLRERNLHQLTTDHTWIQEAIDKGILDPGAARANPNIHVIRRFLGSPRPADADIRLRLDRNESDKQAEANQGLLLSAGDRILLCTDGLTDEVSDDEIRAILDEGTIEGSSRHRLEKTAKRLIDLANERGGHDNITVLLLQNPVEIKPEKFPWLLLGLMLLGICLFLGGAAALVFLRLQKLIAF